MRLYLKYTDIFFILFTDFNDIVRKLLIYSHIPNHQPLSFFSVFSRNTVASISAVWSANASG